MKLDTNDVTREIERLGFVWREIAQYDISNLAPERRIQVRDSYNGDDNFAPSEEIDRIAEQMVYKENIAPIVVTMGAEPWLVDGNTRTGATTKLGRDKIHAIEIDIDYDQASGKDKQKLGFLGSILNSNHGKALSKGERGRWALEMLRAGYSVDEIVRAYGIKRTTVNGLKNQLAAEKRMHQVGLDDLVPGRHNINSEGKITISTTVMRALGGRDVIVLNDGPYRKLVQLTYDAKLNVHEVKQLAEEVKALGSDVEQENLLDARREEYAGRIDTATKGGSSNATQPWAMVVRYLGYINKHAGWDLVAPMEHSERYIKSLKTAQGILADTIEIQERIFDSEQ